jgi:hypothetical protein
MKILHAVALTAFVLTVAACDDTRAPPVTAVPEPAGSEPASAPAEATPALPVAAPLATFEGFDVTRFGMDEAAFRAAWKGELGVAGEGECFHLSPDWATVPADFAFMFEQGVFVRYSTEAPRELAPGGGRVGMLADEIRALYAGRIDETPHKYVPGALYLRVADAGGSGLVFEADPDGRISEWRVGRIPQVDYVEGCS